LDGNGRSTFEFPKWRDDRLDYGPNDPFEPWFLSSVRSEEGFPVLFNPILFGITQKKYSFSGWSSHLICDRRFLRLYTLLERQRQCLQKN
jgi:hypothetical protein